VSGALGSVDSAATFDVVVIGAGLAGAAAAESLTRRGRSVCVLEADSPAGAGGSSHGSARIFRRAYPEPFWIDLTGRAQRAWRDLEDRSGTSLLRLTGGIDHGDIRQPALIAEGLRAAGIPHDLLPAAAAAERWPGLRFAGPVLFHPDAGPLDPETTVAAMLTLVADAGGAVHHHSPVDRIETVSGGVRVHTPGGSVRGAVAVIAAGAWLPDLLDRCGRADLHRRLPTLTVTQHQIFHFPRRDPLSVGAVDGWPIFIHQMSAAPAGAGAAGSVYGLPGGRDAGPGGGIKIGEHDRGTPTTADTRDGIVDAGSRARVTGYVQTWLPGLVPEPYAEASCLYTDTPNDDFVLDRVGPLVLASPCSGHGAKFAPVIGELIADLATGSAPVPRFTLAAA
jgi:monomeric sarcosine oxidase